MDVIYSTGHRYIEGLGDVDKDAAAGQVTCQTELDMSLVPRVGYNFMPAMDGPFCDQNWGLRPLVMDAGIDLLLETKAKRWVELKKNIIFDGGIAGATAAQSYTPHPNTCPPGYVDGGNADTGVALPVGCNQDIVDGGVVLDRGTYDAGDLTSGLSRGSAVLLDGGNLSTGYVADQDQIIADGGILTI